MKNFIFGVLILSLFFMSCSKKEPVDIYPVYDAVAPYDTIAKDSFSQGATSVDISRQVKISTKKHQDSLKKGLK